MGGIFQAVMIAEGSEPVCCEEEYLAAWQQLVDSGLAWQLQGWFGRTAQDLIEQGLIELPEQQGWEEIDSLHQEVIASIKEKQA